MEERKTVDSTSAGTITPKSGANPRTPYPHQDAAMKCLGALNNLPSYSTLLVLPTGGGKTYTASTWLLSHALNNGRKVLWIAHRELLLNQARESFIQFAHETSLSKKSSFRYRIISGASEHGKMIDIKNDDNLLIIGKDSLVRNIDKLKPWLEGENELFLVIDEAHHATARSYRKIIDFLKESGIKNLKIIGLTATPYRTAGSEKTLLSKIFPDGIDKNTLEIIHGENKEGSRGGFVYDISLKELIETHILSNPIFIERYSEKLYGKNIGIEDLERIHNFDDLPPKIAEEIVSSKERNRLIVDTYLDGKDDNGNKIEFGQTLVFAVNQTHAIVLAKLFNESGVKAAYVISNVRDTALGVTHSSDDNARNIEAFRNGDIKVLVNVNILTEGTDLPQTQSVFLARPTTSMTLMTQMVGRALRGEAAGGTKDAYIVSFIDNWNKNIAWVNPESLMFDDRPFPEKGTAEYVKAVIDYVSTAKIEEFAQRLDATVDTSKLESIPFIKTIPLGSYRFSYLIPSGGENGDDLEVNCSVPVYDSTKSSYDAMMDDLKRMFERHGVTDENLSHDAVSAMAEECRQRFFSDDMIPPYDERDIIDIIKYYAAKGAEPPFFPLDGSAREKLDVSKIAEDFVRKDLRLSEQKAYLDKLWGNEDDNLLRLYFGKFIYFKKALDTELSKLTNPDEYGQNDQQSNVIPEQISTEDLSIARLRDVAPEYAEKLVSDVFNKSKDADGLYTCAECGYKSKSRRYMQVDHIVPMVKGGKSVPENLQILCARCNMIKGGN